MTTTGTEKVLTASPSDVSPAPDSEGADTRPTPKKDRRPLYKKMLAVWDEFAREHPEADWGRPETEEISEAEKALAAAIELWELGRLESTELRPLWDRLLEAHLPRSREALQQSLLPDAASRELSACAQDSNLGRAVSQL